MSSDNNEQYACKCLNVRITAASSPSPPPQHLIDSDYTPVFVKDDGISVIHPQVTVRVPLKSEPIPGTSKYFRFTLLTCLLCSVPVYRVYNVISQEVEGVEATLMPSEDWVENAIMKSSTGWICVHKDSLNGNKIPEAFKSPTYIPIFSLTVDTTSASSFPPLPTEPEDPLAPQDVPPPEAPQKEYLSDLRPLFLPPPYTSSNPIFVHLAGIASQESLELRAAAERRIADFVKAETAGLGAKETELIQQVQVLWNNFKDNLKAVQRERPHVISNIGRNLSRNAPSSLAGPARPSPSVAIRDFSPQRVASPLGNHTSASVPRLSALSSSLATSQFYNPKEIKERSSSRSSGSNETVSSPRSASSTLVTPLRGDGSILQYVATNNDMINTQASYRYLMTLEEDMARYKEAKKQDSEAVSDNQEAGPSGAQSNTNVNGTRNTPPPEDPKLERQSSTSTSRSRDKAKKVVKFAETEQDVPTDKVTDADDADGPMIFNLEMADQPEDASQPSTSPHIALPLLDPPVSRPRHRNARAHIAQDPYSALRPSSLPAPSHIRPMRSQPGVDSFSQSILLNLPPRIVNGDRYSPPMASSSSSGLVSDTNAAHSKQVAADAPNHRGSWAPESRAWREFARRQNSKDSTEHSYIPEEGEIEVEVNGSSAIAIGTMATGNVENKDPEIRGGVPASLPVNIRSPIAKPRETITLASYRPQTAISESTAEPPEPLGPDNKPLTNMSSAAIRKALYTARDRNRAIDPGALDFPVDEDDEDESEESDDEQDRVREVGEQGRRNALKIIQARDELPAEGMWRSLA